MTTHQIGLIITNSYRIRPSILYFRIDVRRSIENGGRVLDRLSLGVLNLPGRLCSLSVSAANETRHQPQLGISGLLRKIEKIWQQKRISAGWILVRRTRLWLYVFARICSADGYTFRSLLAIPYVEPPKDKNDVDMTGTD